MNFLITMNNYISICEKIDRGDDLLGILFRLREIVGVVCLVVRCVQKPIHFLAGNQRKRASDGNYKYLFHIRSD